MFVSELIGVPIVDRLQEPVGEVKDIIITVGEVFPRVTGLYVKIPLMPNCQIMLMPEIDLIGRQFIVTRSVADRVVCAVLRPNDVLLGRDVLDRQIVDTEGARVIRVNDLKLAKVDQDVRLIAADVGWRGMLRRLKLLGLIEPLFALFRREVPDTLIGWDHVESLKTGKTAGPITIPSRHIAELHPADIANIISQVHSEERTALFASLSEKTAAESLHELEPKIQALLLMTLDTKKALGVLDKMPVDEVADVLGDLPPEKTEELLRLMKHKKAAAVAKLLNHPEETAGGLMTTEFITIPDGFSVQQTIERMRELAPEAETVYYLYVVNEQEKLAGIISLRNLIVAAPERPIREIMIQNFVTVSPAMNQREVAQVISKYNLLAVPVVDGDNKILGIVTVDDVVDFILPPFSRRKRQMLG